MLSKLITVISLCIYLLLLQPIFAEEVNIHTIPPWLTKMMRKDYIGKEIPVSITENEFRGQKVFIIDRSMACCDLGATMYGKSGKRLCRLIGIAGSWERACSDFPENNKLIRLIYEFKQKPDNAD